MHFPYLRIHENNVSAGIPLYPVANGSRYQARHWFHMRCMLEEPTEYSKLPTIYAARQKYSDLCQVSSLNVLKTPG